MKNASRLLACMAIALVLSACGGGEEGVTYTPRDPNLVNITYKVSGTATQAALTYENETGGTSQQTVGLPWEKRFEVEKGDFVYLSAQNQGATGTVTVQILANDKLYKAGLSDSAYGIASASGLCCE